MMLKTVLFAGLVGAVAHRSVFIRGEWHLHVSQVLFTHLSLILALFLWLFGEAKGLGWALSGTISHTLAYLTGLFASIIVYRLFFHRLRHFPAPRLVAASKLWHVWKARGSQNFLVLEEWHQKYGTFVRTGPEEITIFHPAAFEVIDGPGNHNTRTDWYDLVHPFASPIFCRDPAVHIERRRIWAQALSTKAIDAYLPRILKQISVLESAIRASGSRGILLNDTMCWFTFDSMGEFAFNESFGQMQSSSWHKEVKQQRSALSILGPFSSAIWAVRLAFAFGSFIRQVADWNAMVSFCTKCIERRLETSTEQPDIASYFISEFHANAKVRSLEERRNLLVGNSVSVVVGGSDTTGSSLILLWYALAKYPEHAEKIYAELCAIDETDAKALAALPHLNGFMNEVMRLLPSAPTLGIRIAPPEGIWFDDTFIPGNTKMAAPKYSIFRLEAAFERPLEFLPERWTTSPELVKDKRAFAPFGTGRRACVGKNLALTQIRLVAAIILRKYRVAFAPGQDIAVVEAAMKDQVTAQPGPCRVIFEPRTTV